MARGLGIASLVVALLGIFVPVVTIYVIWLALSLAAVSGFLGDKAFPIASALACLVNILFMSPLTLMALKGENLGGGSFLMMTTLVLFVAPIAAMILGAMRGRAVETSVK